MSTFITIGYGDRGGYERTDPSVRDAAHKRSDLPVAGFAIIEAASLEDAVVEVWPLEATG
jgi:hypothetical protein